MRTRQFLAVIMLFSATGVSRAGTLTSFTNESAFHASATSLTNIGFDEYSGGEILNGDEYNGLGLSIVQRDSQPLQILSPTFGFTQYHNLNLNSLNAGLGSAGSTENIDFIFSSGVLSAGLWVGNIGDLDGSNNPDYYDDSNGTLVQFFGVSGNVLASMFLRTDTPGIIQGAASPNNRIFYGVSYSGSIAGVDPIKTIRVIEGAGDADNVVFDNVQYSGAAVPEPSSLCLVVVAVGPYVLRRVFFLQKTAMCRR
ncbi:MAG: hypothetical protein WCH39_23880 [Schlesneria sp.]